MATASTERRHERSVRDQERPARPRKHWGQHFLHEKHVAEKIIDAVNPQKKQHIIEIGPGRGVLTGRLLTSQAQLSAVEIDAQLVEQLEAQFGTHPRFALYHADAMKFDYSNIPSWGTPVRVVANLPYNIGTALLFRMLAWEPVALDMHLMLQREVAARLYARPNSPDYGRLSVMAQSLCATITRVLSVAPGAFTPPPEVHSEFVRLVPHQTPPAPHEQDALNTVTCAAFSARRKTLKHALGKLMTAEDLHQLGIDPQQRPQQLSPTQYLGIARAISQNS